MGSCCIGDCCIGDCCVMDWCLFDSGCGYHPGPSVDELHAKKIADELAVMKEKIRQQAERMEEEIISDINESIDEFIEVLSNINKHRYGGKYLDLNIDGIRKENENLKNQIRGHIGDFMDERLVLTDKELSLVLAERDDAKREKNFDAFCVVIKKQAVLGLKDSIEKTVIKQSVMIRKEVENRLSEVDRKMKELNDAYIEIAENKKNDSEVLKNKQIQYMYKHELSEILIDLINN